MTIYTAAIATHDDRTRFILDFPGVDPQDNVTGYIVHWLDGGDAIRDEYGCSLHYGPTNTAEAGFPTFERALGWLLKEVKRLDNARD